MLHAERTEVAHPFEGLLAALEDELPAILDEVVRLLRPERPDYADFLAGERDEVALAGRNALHRIVVTAQQAWLAGRAVTGAEDTARDHLDVDLELFVELGRVQWRSGNPLSDLLSAYQVGARVAWRVLSHTAVQHGVPANCVALLAEAVFVLVSRLSSTSARGYVEVQSRAVADRERARAELVELLLSDRSDSTLVHAAAQRADWPLPRTAALVLIDDADEAVQERLSVADPGWLTLRRSGVVGFVVPDPDGPARRHRVELLLKSSGAVVGRTVSPQELPASWRVTFSALQLRQQGVLDGDPVFVEDHLAAVIVHGDPRLLEVLRARVLAPLDAVPAETRERLLETLLSWLRHMGNRQQVAMELHVHRQTVRYRLAQLAELFGPALDDHAVLLQLRLALEWRDVPEP